MKVSEVIAMARSSELSNLSSSSFTDSRIIQYINLAIIELSKRFVVSTKAENIKTSVYTSMYVLRSPDVIGIIDIYDQTGKALVCQTLTDDLTFDYKLINNTTFLLNHKEDYRDKIEYHPITGIDELQCKKEPDKELMVIYSAVADLVSKPEDELPIPLVMLDALLAYIGYKATYSITPDGNGIHQAAMGKYEASCKLLESSAYGGQNTIVSKSLQSKGFI